MAPGGGVVMIRTLKALKDLEGSNEDQTVGIRPLARAIEEPLCQIVENVGEDAAVVLNALKAGRAPMASTPRTASSATRWRRASWIRPR